MYSCKAIKRASISAMLKDPALIRESWQDSAKLSFVVIKSGSGVEERVLPTLHFILFSHLYYVSLNYQLF